MRWPTVALDEVCTRISDGTHQAPKWAVQGVPFLFVSNVRNGTISFETSKFVSYEEYENLTRNCPIEPGDVLYTAVGSYGNAAVVPAGRTFVFQRHIAQLKPRHDRLDPTYLSHALEAPVVKAQADRLARGIAQKTVTLASLKEFQIPLPPLPEQRRIAAILDKADALRRKRQRAVDLLDSLTQSIFLEMFGEGSNFPLVQFESAVFFQEGPGVRNWQFRDTGIKLINVRNIVDGDLDPTNTWRHLDPAEVDQKYKHFMLEADDLVLASSGVTWGKVAEVKTEHLPLCLNTSVIRLRAKNGYERSFIRSFVEHGSFKSQIDRLITGSAQPNFGPSHLRQVQIPSPSAELQRSFKLKYAQTAQTRESASRQLMSVKSFFASLQSRAFAGEL